MVHPLKDNILVVELNQVLKTRSGIILNNSNNSGIMGVIKAFGPDCIIENINTQQSIEIENIVLFLKEKAISVTNEGNDYLIISQKDIIAVID